MNRVHTLIASTLLAICGFGHAGELAIIGHANVPKLDNDTLTRLYTGRIIQLGNVSVIPLNLKPGHRLRGQFLADLLNMDEDRYTAYWTVRRYIGKGAPPKELDHSTDIISLVQSTPGAIGYIDANELKPGMNLLLRH